METSPSKIRVAEFMGWVCKSRAKGASFCQVDRMRPVVRFNPCRTSGSQVCTGARPIFRARAMVRRASGRGWVS